MRQPTRRVYLWLLGLVLAVGLLATPVALGSRAASSVQADPALGAAVAAELNAARAGSGLRRLKTSAQLRRAAQAHAVSMGVLGYFSHSSADGASSTRRITSYYPVRRATGWAVGEVLAWAADDMTASQAVAMWLASGPHRAQLLSPRWRELGVAAVRVANAPGVYGGRNVTIIVVDFGLRR